MAKATVLVASPSAIGSTPVASGSRVPPCPTFSALRRRRTFATACAELIPAGLSRTSQPCTGTPRRLRAILVPVGVVAVGLVGSEIAMDLGTMQQLVDSGCVIEGGIEPEGEPGRIAQIDLAGDHAAQVGRGTREPRERLPCAFAGEWHHEDGGVAEVRAHANFRHREGHAGE